MSSTTSPNRKSLKPVMERKRRARINASLAELKSLLVEDFKAEGTRQNKIEKADILEMTVRHLRSVHKNKCMDTDSRTESRIKKYRLGFSECASEVSQYLENVDCVETEFRSRLLNHLTSVTMSSGQDTENSDSDSVIPLILGQQMQDHIHQKSPNLKNTANIVQNNTWMTTNQSFETQEEADQRVYGNTCDAAEVSSVQNPISMASNLLCSKPSTTAGVSSGEVAFLVPASSFLQYNHPAVSCSSVFIRLVQPVNIQSSSAPCISPVVVANSSPSTVCLDKSTIAKLQTEQKLTFQPETATRINDRAAFQSTNSVQCLNDLTSSQLGQNKMTLSLSSNQSGQNDCRISKEKLGKETKGSDMWRPR